ncbi:MFS transporter [Duganella sp. LX20W]|uniref:MFS transporter n=1 Tax=Rugamonas brunnea TaxID=2758569 RepID=A0A7W2ETD0_9BURK|nr:MFS transporter [Rugamonas brunnea]MBA5638259.1 MFS transporter [Rugamonas brunnea]
MTYASAHPDTDVGPRWWRLAAYGLLGLPLAMAALPVYVHVAAYYSALHGVALAQLGWVLFGARLLDTLQDPLQGHVIDRLRGGVARWMMAGGAILALAFAGIWQPPASGTVAAIWLGVMLVLAYCAHSMLNIAYLTWGAGLTGSGAQRSKDRLSAAAWREGAGLAGLVVASVIPATVMAGEPARIPASMALYSVAFAVLLMVALALLLKLAPAWPRPNPQADDWRCALRRMASNRGFVRLLLPYLLNACSVSLPATLALFFIRDQLQAAELAGAFLGCYFIAAACGLPLWTALARRIGVLACWRIGMALAIASFAGASLLGAGDVLPYFAICIGAGAALGADLAMPPVLLAELLGAGEAAGAYYGVFTLLGKLALALSGLALPVLAALGYRPGIAGSTALVLVYAAVPCLLKLLAMASLRAPSPAPLPIARYRSSP